MVVDIRVQHLMPVLHNSGKTVWVYDNSENLMWSGISECMPDWMMLKVVDEFSAQDNNAKIVIRE